MMLRLIKRISTPLLFKAVDAHHSQSQQRKRGKFVRFHHGRVQPRDSKGQFSGLLPQGERDAAYLLSDKYRADLELRLRWIMQDVKGGRIDPQVADERGQVEIDQYYTMLYRTGMQYAGHPGIILSGQDKSALARVIKDEADYFRGFMHDVDAGAGVWDYDRRTSAYGSASLHSFWLGFVLGNQRKNRRIYWDLGTSEHCSDCLFMNSLGGMTVQDFLKYAVGKGWLPRSGDLECKGIHCQCKLRDTTEG